MKKLSVLSILIIALFTLPAFALDFTTTFTWEQNEEAVPLVARWECQDVESQQIVAFVNNGGPGPFQATEDFTFESVPGDVIRTYQIRAIGNSGTVTGWSNQIPKTYTITEESIIQVPVLISVE